jgi:phosphate transport system permease protein
MDLNNKETLNKIHNSKIKLHNFGESFFKYLLIASGIIVVLVLVGIFLTLLIESLPSMGELGWDFFFKQGWDPGEGRESYGALQFIVGTLVTSFLALLISSPFAFAIAVILGEYFKEGFFSGFLKSVSELLAGIPSIIYGFWGFYYLGDFIRELEYNLGIQENGTGILTAAFILAIMIIPYSASIVRDVIELVPQEYKEAAYALGASRFQVIKNVILPYAKSGIFAGLTLSLGRAVGETMAIVLLIGNAKQKIPDFCGQGFSALFESSSTMASIIASEFSEADPGTLRYSALLEIGLMLLLITTVINILGKLIIRKTMVHK